jgi:hypothetical protein
MSATQPLQCTVVILRDDFSIQNAYIAGEKVATEMKIPFQGTNIFTLPVGQAFRFCPTLAFQLDANQIDELTQKLATELKTDKNLLRILVFRTQPVESGRPPPEGMIT